MSMYGESDYNERKNNLYDEIKWFLEDHPISELLQIVADVIEYERDTISDFNKDDSDSH